MITAVTRSQEPVARQKETTVFGIRKNLLPATGYRLPIKLAVLQRTWRMASKGSASRARRELIERASALAASPHNQAEIIDSLIRRCGPLIREHGFAGLVTVLSEKQ